MRAVVYVDPSPHILWRNADSDSVADICRLTQATGLIVFCHAGNLSSTDAIMLALQTGGRQWSILGPKPTKPMVGLTCRRLIPDELVDSTWITRFRAALEKSGKEWDLGCGDYFGNVRPMAVWNDDTSMFPLPGALP